MLPNAHLVDRLGGKCKKKLNTCTLFALSGTVRHVLVIDIRQLCVLSADSEKKSIKKMHIDQKDCPKCNSQLTIFFCHFFNRSLNEPTFLGWGLRLHLPEVCLISCYLQWQTVGFELKILLFINRHQQ